MITNKCPKCKSENIEDQRWIWAMSPNTCNECSYAWEAATHARLSIATYAIGLLLIVYFDVASFSYAEFIVIPVISYFPVLMIYLWIKKSFHKKWKEADPVRPWINYGSPVLLTIIMIWYYANA